MSQVKSAFKLSNRMVKQAKVRRTKRRFRCR